MTNPLVPGPDPDAVVPEPEPDPDGDVITEDAVQEEGNDNKEYWVKTPWYIDSMTLGDGFEDLTVTPKGVKLTGKQRERAYEVAKESGVTLKSKEA